MDDLSSKISEILGSPEEMQKIQSLAAMLGLGGGQESPSPPPPAPKKEEGGGIPGLNLDAIMGIQKAFSQFGTKDKNVDLLYALKPHLSEERAKRVDDAVRIMQLIKVLPALKDSGIFESLGFLRGDA